MDIRRISLSFCVVLLLASDSLFASFFLYAGTYNPSDAETLHRRLADRGYPVYLLYGDNYEVRVGSFDSRQKAEEVAEKLKSDEKIVVNILEEEGLDQSQFTWDSIETDKEVNQYTSQSYQDPQAQKIVSLALELFGHPYKYGGTKIGKGIDCSYFVQKIFHELEISLPRTSREQFKVGREIDRQELCVGDLLFFHKTYSSRKRKTGGNKNFKRINHVGIYIGNGEFIHATINVKRVTISRLEDKYFNNHFAGARRVLQ